MDKIIQEWTTLPKNSYYTDNTKSSIAVEEYRNIEGIGTDLDKDYIHIIENIAETDEGINGWYERGLRRMQMRKIKKIINRNNNKNNSK
tara:strand:- start:168 stop:434 length:267 start_codon:yes stop_codon:yes gene_type:complete